MITELVRDGLIAATCKPSFFPSPRVSDCERTVNQAQRSLV
jgi:hypothetical protein